MGMGVGPSQLHSHGAWCALGVFFQQHGVIKIVFSSPAFMISHVDCTVRLGTGRAVDPQFKESIFGIPSTSTIDGSLCDVQRCARSPCNIHLRLTLSLDP